MPSNRYAPLILDLVGGAIGFCISLPPILAYLIFVKPVRSGVKRRRRRKNGAIAIQNTVIYKPLQPQGEIRLVTVKPSQVQSDVIECTTFHGQLAHASYEALSYAWGNPELRCAIKIDGHNFMITANLYAALKSLRDAHAPRIFWIDSICINQADSGERNQQVQQMKDVYQNASNVVVWLGEVLKRLKDVSNICDPSANLDLKSAGPFYLAMIQNKWWTRTWTVQELLTAEKVEIRYGENDMSWSRVCELVNYLDEKRYQSFALRRAQTMIQLREEHKAGVYHRLGLLGLAWEFRERKASNMRDKLYALLGLVPPEDCVITPQYGDYTQKVFRDFARGWINHHGSLLVLNLARLQSPSLGRWYPRWDLSFDGNITLFWNEGLMSSFWNGVSMEVRNVSWHGRFSAAGGHRAPNCIHHTNKNILQLRGFSHDTIMAVSDTASLNLHKDPKKARDQLMVRWKSFASKATGLPTDDIEEELNDTVTAGFFNSIPTTERVVGFENVVTAACHHRRFFVTSRGSFGLGPSETKVGDSICVLLGAPVPFLLRKKNEFVLNNKWEVEPDNFIRDFIVKHSDPSHHGDGLPIQEFSIPLWTTVGEAYIREIMTYGGDIKSDIASGKLRLEDFYVHTEIYDYELDQ